MDGEFYGKMFDSLIKSLILAGIIIGLVAAGLFYGGYCLVSHYRVKVERRPSATSMVVTNTVTNYIYLPNTNK